MVHGVLLAPGTAARVTAGETAERSVELRMESRDWHNGEWSVTTLKGPIADTNELDALETRLAIPMPEMVFGKNALRIEHKPSQFALVFDAASALDAVDKAHNGKTKTLRVAHAEAWRASKIRTKREHPVQPGQIDYDVDRVHRPFDWTYTSDYKGTTNREWVTSATPIPYEELKRPDPIAFFDDVPLYEDELGDFGLTTYSAKVRVMPNSLLVLARLYMRVDNVAFRVRDTRVYIDFRTNQVVREYTEKEGTYDEVRRRVPVWAEDFTQMLRDPQWVDGVLPPLTKEIMAISL